MQNKDFEWYKKIQLTKFGGKKKFHMLSGSMYSALTKCVNSICLEIIRIK